MNPFNFLYYKIRKSAICKFCSEDPHFPAVLAITMCELFISYFIVYCLRGLEIIDLTKTFFDFKIMNWVFLLSLLYLNKKYYHRDREEKICEHYDRLAEDYAFFRMNPIIVTLIYLCVSLSIFKGGSHLIDYYVEQKIYGWTFFDL